MRRYVTAGAAALAALTLVLAATAGAKGEVDPVGSEIDEITRPPAYDWLRDPGQASREAGREPRARPQREGRPRSLRESQDEGGCGYRPAPGKEPAGGKEGPNTSEGCGAGGSPGASGPQVTPAQADAGGCGASRGACRRGEGGCNAGIGDCACDYAIGSGGCGGCGRVIAPAGYLFAALALGLLVLLVVRAVLRRERKSRDSEVGVIVAAGSPDEVRVSQVAGVPAETLMDKAARAAAAGDFRAAVGWAYLAGLSAVHRGGFVDLHASTTNERVVAETRRRGGPHEATARLVRIFEDVFFGARQATDGHWLECRRMVEEELGTLPAHRL